MIILTIVNSEGRADAPGREASIFPFSSCRNMLKFAYGEYKQLFKAAKEEGYLDDEEQKMLSFNRFKAQLLEDGFTYIQFVASHIQFEIDVLTEWGVIK